MTNRARIARKQAKREQVKTGKPITNDRSMERLVH